MNIYLKAAETIERYGWIQGELGNEYIGYCMIGALRHSNHRMILFIHQLEALTEVLDGRSISFANDELLASDTEAIIALTLAACLEDDLHESLMASIDDDWPNL